MPRSPQRQFRYRLMAARGCGSVSQSPEHAFRPHARRAPHHESAEYVDRGRSREVTRGVTTLHPKQSGEVVVTSSNGGMIFADAISFCRRQSQLSPWFAGERLPQRCQPVERGSRQRAFLDRGERILELLWRCHTDQDGAHRRMRERKPRGSFGETQRDGALPRGLDPPPTPASLPVAVRLNDVGVVPAGVHDPQFPVLFARNGERKSSPR